MKARDLMVSPVITVGPDTPVRDIAELLYKLHISGVPVLDDGRLVGLVSEADLLHRHEIGTDRIVPPDSWWGRLFSTDRSPAEYVKSHANRARDVMTRTVVSVAPETPLAEVAALLERHGFRSIPVLRAGKLVGIVSRADLIRALAAVPRARSQTEPPGDRVIRAKLLAELAHQPWWGRVTSNVVVTEGVVHYFGVIEAGGERDAARVAAENVPGVRRVEDHRFRYSDIASAT